MTIFLFKILDDKVAYLNSLVVTPPTIRDFYQNYKQLFLAYDANTNLIGSIKDLRKSSKNFQGYRDFTNHIANLHMRKKELNAKALHIKKILVAYQGLFLKTSSKPEFDRRVLEEDPGKNLALSRVADEVSLQSLALDIGVTLEAMKQELREVQKVGEEKFNYFQVLLANFGNLSRETHKLLKAYGDVYVLANRLWATSENIFELNKARYQELMEELQMNLYEFYENSQNNIHLPLNEFYKWGRIDAFDSRISIDRPAVLLCQIQAKYVVQSLSSMNPSFDLAIVINNGIEHVPEGFDNEIKGTRQVFNIKKMVLLEEGENNIGLYAQVKKADISFDYISIRCYRMMEMKGTSTPN
jgi:hypothetical protein